MIDSFSIGSVIRSTLMQIPELQGKIFPLVAENGTTIPFCIYQIQNITRVTKFGSDEITIQISILTEFYTEPISTQIREYMENAGFSYTGYSESYNGDAYLKELRFTYIN